MFAPGAIRSGLMYAWPIRPYRDPDQKLSVLLTAPTVSAERAVPGAVTLGVPGTPGEVLPAATTNSVWYRALSASRAWLIGSSPLVTGPPRLRLTTSAPCSA